MTPLTIDCDYTGPGIASAYLLRDGDEAAFVETNTSLAVPRLLAALGEAGLAPQDVRYVIVTHIHLDHAGGAGQLMAVCPNATLLAHPRAAPHAVDPTRIVAGATAVYGEERFAELYGQILPAPAARVRALADGERVGFGGRELEFLHTRGHANHHFCVVDGPGVYTGDSFGIVYPRLQGGGTCAFPSTSPTDFDGEAALASVDRILATGATAAYPTHFGAQSDLVGIADQLRQMLVQHTAIADEADRSGRDGEDLDRYCDERVRTLFAAKLDAHGLGGDAEVARIVELDVDLNGQGLAFSVRKRRYKRSKA